MRVLLTGGAGFLGSHLSEALLERGAEVHCLDNFDPFYPRAYKEANLKESLESERFFFTEGDFRDAELVRDLLREASPDVVIHLGAKAGVRPSVEKPLDYVSVNVTGTALLLEACREAGVDKFLFASSSSVYGDDSPVPFREDVAANRPASPYAATKKACEEIAHTFHQIAGIDIVCLRYFTIYGPRQRPEMAIHKFSRYLTQARPIPLYGEGRLERDYTYVSDAIAGTLSAIDFVIRTRPCFEIVNVGGARKVELRELVSLLEQAFGARARIRYEPRPVGDVQSTWADISKARRLFGFDPSIQIEEGIRRFAEWFTSERPDLLVERPTAV